MNLRLVRETFTEESCIGRLFINEKFECYTLEDAFRKVKIRNETCIPVGTYEIIISYSERFMVPLPLLLRVPNFEGIRIHWGNKAADTSGCILLGTERKPDFVTGSKIACSNLFKRLFPAAATEKIYISILHKQQF